MNWFQLALRLQGSVAPVIFPRVLFFSSLGILVSYLYNLGYPVSWKILGSVITNVVFNLVLGLLLVFRTNTAYERFWEGRKLWGVITINSRNLARQIWTGVAENEPGDRAEKIALLNLLNAFAIATKLYLRQEPIDRQLESFLTPVQSQQLQETKTPPLTLIFWMGTAIGKQHKRNNINSYQLAAFNQLLDNLVEALTGCDRIVKTPIPLAYSIYLKRVLLIYCLALPFQYVATAEGWTGTIVGLISFVLLGIEEIGNEIENPFGLDPNDLLLDEICQTIQDNLEDLMTIASEVGSQTPIEAV